MHCHHIPDVVFVSLQIFFTLFYFFLGSLCLKYDSNLKTVVLVKYRLVFLNPVRITFFGQFFLFNVSVQDIFRIILIGYKIIIGNKFSWKYFQFFQSLFIFHMKFYFIFFLLLLWNYLFFHCGESVLTSSTLLEAKHEEIKVLLKINVRMPFLIIKFMPSRFCGNNKV